jgi:hypothetical protein
MQSREKDDSYPNGRQKNERNIETDTDKSSYGSKN